MYNASQNGFTVLGAGKKPKQTILFLADLNFELRFYQYALRILAEHFVVYALAMPGSDNVPLSGTLTKRALAQHVIEFVRKYALSETKFAVVAHGTVGAALDGLLSKFANCIRGIVMVNPVVFYEEAIEMYLAEGKCCTQQIDVYKMEAAFVKLNFAPKFALWQRNFEEKMAFYAARDGYDAFMRDEFTVISQFCYDKYIGLTVVFADGCKNMRFNKSEALKVFPAAKIIKGYNFCFDEPKMMDIIVKACKEAPRSHICGEVEISV